MMIGLFVVIRVQPGCSGCDTGYMVDGDVCVCVSAGAYPGGG